MSLTDAISKGLTADDARAIMEFEKMRFELSWRYFDFHARQRTQLFHFFIILTPFILGGCFYLFKERASVGPWPSFAASCVGALLAIIFFGLDRRNRCMIGISERAIKLLEKNLLYPSNFRPLLEMGEPFRGVVTTEGEETSGRRLSWFRGHSCLVGAVYWIAFLSFVALAMYVLAVQRGCVKIG